MMPLRLTSPTVGLIPTTKFWVPGLRMDPDVSVPIPTVARSALTAIPGPELEPPGESAGRPSLNGVTSRGSGRGSNGFESVSTERAVARRHPVCKKISEFGQSCLSDNDRARGAQLSCDEGIVRRNGPGQSHRTRGCWHVEGIDVVF